MPPQQFQRLLDFLDHRFGFSAHRHSFLPASGSCRAF
jgi:hypothetical protein